MLATFQHRADKRVLQFFLETREAHNCHEKRDDVAFAAEDVMLTVSSASIEQIVHTLVPGRELVNQRILR
jgi:hypothetical protein